METLLYVLGFVIGALGTSFLLYFLKTRKLLRTQHELILNLTFALVGKDVAKKREEMEKADKEMADHIAAKEAAKESVDCTASESEPAK